MIEVLWVDITTYTTLRYSISSYVNASGYESSQGSASRRLQAVRSRASFADAEATHSAVLSQAVGRNECSDRGAHLRGRERLV